MLQKAVFIILSVSLVISRCEVIDDATLDDFLNNEESGFNAFLHNEMNRVKQVIKSTYVGIDTDTLRARINGYTEQQKKKLTADVNNYVEQLKNSRKKVADLWNSFVPTEDPGSRMENPESTLSVPAMIARNGYDCETHTIASQGYILNIHRIPRSKNNFYFSPDTVILHHGLFDSSFDWVLNGAEKSLAYALADAGYDVWMPNARGNIHQREHAWYKTNTKEFWNFSFHEHALYDVPALIDYIRKLKGNKTKIAYVGHSMGNTILFSMLSLRPEYNDKLTVGMALAPAVFLSNMKFPFGKYRNLITNIINTAMWYHSYEIFQKDFTDKVSANCKDVYGQIACQNLLFNLVGEDKEQMNAAKFSDFFLKASSTSWKTVAHYIQMINSGEFKQFDYGSAEFNKIVYGYDSPPEYDLSKVKLNVTLFWAQNDAIVDEKDVLKLHDKLPHTQLYKVPHPKFNHIDFTWAKDAPRLVNDKVLEILRSTMRNHY